MTPRLDYDQRSTRPPTPWGTPWGTPMLHVTPFPPCLKIVTNLLFVFSLSTHQCNITKHLKEPCIFSHLLKSSWGTRAIGLNSNGTTSHIFTRSVVKNNCLNNIQI